MYLGVGFRSFHPDLQHHQGAVSTGMPMDYHAAPGLESTTRSLDSHSFLKLKAYLLAARGVVFGAGVPWNKTNQRRSAATGMPKSGQPPPPSAPGNIRLAHFPQGQIHFLPHSHP
jgi:hypothetical protein